MEQFISGESTDLHNVALASQKAALDFEMFLQVRNKVVQAYQEVMRLQL
jgi:flagellar hook-basal body complex protein FliE